MLECAFLKHAMDSGMCWGPLSNIAKYSDLLLLSYTSISNFKEMKLQAARFFLI